MRVAPVNHKKEKSTGDHTLLDRLRNGDGEAAYTLYVKYASPLLSLAQREAGAQLASRLDPEDIVQSVFRTFFRRASEGQYEVPEGADLWRLLLVIALNKIRRQCTYHKSSKRDVRRTDVLYEDAASADDEQMAVKILQMSIDDLTASMPEANRKIVTMRIEGYSVQEICDAVRRSKRTVERVLQNFRRQLLEVLQPDLDGHTES